jgi:hypothetical protein
VNERDATSGLGVTGDLVPGPGFLQTGQRCCLDTLIGNRMNNPRILSHDGAGKPKPTNASAHRERPHRALSDLTESQRGRDAVARRDTHPGLLCCTLSRGSRMAVPPIHPQRGNLDELLHAAA